MGVFVLSRLTKYLKQSSTLEKVSTTPDGQPVMDAYGNYTYESPIMVPCRKESAMVSASTAYGKFVNHQSVYYFDETVSIHVNDKLDGHVVLQVYPYTGGEGELVGLEVHV